MGEMTMNFAVNTVSPLGPCAVQVVVDIVVLARHAWAMVHVREEEVCLREALLPLEARDRVVVVAVAVPVVDRHHHLLDVIQAKRNVDRTTASTPQLVAAVQVNTAMLARNARIRGPVSTKMRSAVATERTVMLESSVPRLGVAFP